MKTLLLLVCLTLGACVHGGRASLHPLSPPPEGARTAIFISDLHMGPGRGPGDAWHAFEDFRWEEDFAAFLTKIDASGGATDLVLVGDAFELWQSSTKECASCFQDAGCTEGEALARLDRALRDHAPVIRALGAFARRGDNRVYFLPGNHDAALLFPGVAERLLAALEAPGRAAVPESGYWLSPDGRVYAEHGHQIPGDLNAYEDWPKPFVGVFRRHLRRSWGEQFVRSFFNPYELSYPVIDNVNPASAGVSYGLAHEKLAGLGRALGRFIVFALTRTSPLQAGEFAGGAAGGAVAWDVAAIRKQKGAFLQQALADDDPLSLEAAAAGAAGGLDEAAAALGEEEILEICEERAALADETPPRASRCPTLPGAGAAAGRVLSSRRKAIGERMAGALADVRRAAPEREPFTVFIWGHSHVAEAASRVDAPAGWGADVLNSGAWQRVVSRQWFETNAKAEGLPKKDWITGIHLDDLPRCYSFIRSPASGGAPQLVYWSAASDGQFAEAESCVAACRTKGCGAPVHANQDRAPGPELTRASAASARAP